MSRKFAVFDIDGTLVRWQLYHAVVDELIAGGKLPKSVGQAIEQARMTWKRRGHLESFQTYEHLLWQSYTAAVTQIPIASVEAAVATVFKTHKDQVYIYTRDLISSLRGQGYLLFAISGSHQEIVEKLAAYYGFDDAVGTRYIREQGVFTGEEVSTISRKDAVLRQLVAKHDASWEHSIGIGDSKSDVGMLQLVASPIAFNPNQDLFGIAQAAGWKIVVERKNMIYELEPSNGTYVLAQTNAK